METVYLFHHDWCEGGYTDPMVEVYSTYELALERLNKVWEWFLECNNSDCVEINDKDCKRWQDNEYVFDVYISKEEVRNQLPANH